MTHPNNEPLEPSEKSATDAKKKPMLPLAIGIVAAVALVAVVAFGVVPSPTPQPTDQPKAEASAPAEEQVAAGEAKTDNGTNTKSVDESFDDIGKTIAGTVNKTDANSTAEKTSSKNDGNIPTLTKPKDKASLPTLAKPKDETTSSSTEKPKEGSDSQTTEKPSDEKPSSDKPSETQTSEEPNWEAYSTPNTPVIQEFDWFTSNRDISKMPAGAQRLATFDAVQGGWKGYTYNAPASEHGSASEELLNVYLTGSSGDVEATFDWYYTRNLGTGDVHESFMENTIYNGTWFAGGIEAVGMGSIRLTTFWYQDGHEYAIGTIHWPDASQGKLALTRP